MAKKGVQKWSKKGSKMAFFYVEKMGGQKLIKKWSKNGQKLNKIDPPTPPSKKVQKIGGKIEIFAT